jgi:hypothetical protein
LQPTSINHCGNEFDLTHLQQSFGTFSWLCLDGGERNFSVRIRYSDHCISEAVVGSYPAGSHVFQAGVPHRIFDVDRYTWSLELPAIIDDLLSRPTTSIQLTPENNGYIFRLAMSHPLQANEKYYCFIRLKRSAVPVTNQVDCNLDLFVESAYPRLIPPIKAKERQMFGRLAERLVP